MIIEKTGYPDTRRIVDVDGRVLALCVRYTSGFWAVHDKDTDHRLCLPTHKTPTKAMRWLAATPKQEPDQCAS